MKFVKWLIVAVAVLLGLFVAVTFFLPQDYYVERTVEINAPAAVVYSQVADLEAWQEWNPWSDLDPDMEITYGDSKAGQGASYSWISEAAGNGKMTITEAEAPKHVRYELSFAGYESQPSFSEMILKSDNPMGPTSVTWTFEGDVGDKLFARWLAVLMDKFVGANYEKGLAALKERCETMSAAG